EDLGERNLAGRGRLLGPDRVAVGEREFSARRIILATGSRPVLPKPWAELGERVFTTDSLFERADLPRRIAVIGLGAIGVEMAQALARLGIEVTAFSSSNRLAGLRDDKVNATLRNLLDQEFSIHTGSEVQLEAAGAGVRVKAGDTSIDVDAVLA